jgi:thymidylate synthase (FAD)
MTIKVGKEIDAWRGKKLETLGGQGFVRLVDFMGDDSSITQAARISYGAGTKSVHEDEGLIRYLMRHHHTTPFEMCEIKFHVRVPMDCWRQWIRHRTASVNEYSTRYSEAINDMQVTPQDHWRLQAKGNRQGSRDFLPSGPVKDGGLAYGQRLTKLEKGLHEQARYVYKERLDAGVAREQARKDLPLSTFTEAYWKIDLHNLLHFLTLRLDSHAQQEIREYAKTIAQVVAVWVPLTWAAFLDYRRQAITFSDRELFVLAYLAGRVDEMDLWATLAVWGWTKPDRVLPKNRERDECVEKLKRIGFTPPWE